MIYLASKRIYVKTRLASCFLAVAGLAVIVTPACYTLLRHPLVKRVVYEEVTDRRCNGCHEQDELWAFHHPPNHRFRMDSGHSNWNRYYDSPWWYNEYWYYDHDAARMPRVGAFPPGAGRIPGERRAEALRSQRGATPRPPLASGPALNGKTPNETSKKRTV